MPTLNMDADYWVTEHISMEEVKKHMRHNLHRGDSATIHKHAKDKPCPGTCERFEIGGFYAKRYLYTLR